MKSGIRRERSDLDKYFDVFIVRIDVIGTRNSIQTGGKTTHIDVNICMGRPIRVILTQKNSFTLVAEFIKNTLHNYVKKA